MYEQHFQLTIMNFFLLYNACFIVFLKNPLKIQLITKSFSTVFILSSLSGHRPLSWHPLARVEDYVCGSLHVSSKNVWEREQLRKTSPTGLKRLLVP